MSVWVNTVYTLGSMHFREGGSMSISEIVTMVPEKLAHWWQRKLYQPSVSDGEECPSQKLMVPSACWSVRHLKSWESWCQEKNQWPGDSLVHHSAPPPKFSSKIPLFCSTGSPDRKKCPGRGKVYKGEPLMQLQEDFGQLWVEVQYSPVGHLRTGLPTAIHCYWHTYFLYCLILPCRSPTSQDFDSLSLSPARMLPWGLSGVFIGLLLNLMEEGEKVQWRSSSNSFLQCSGHEWSSMFFCLSGAALPQMDLFKDGKSDVKPFSDHNGHSAIQVVFFV